MNTSADGKVSMFRSPPSPAMPTTLSVDGGRGDTGEGGGRKEGGSREGTDQNSKQLHISVWTFEDNLVVQTQYTILHLRFFGGE